MNLVELAALDNAHWCDCVVRAHGGAASFAADAWTSPRRTPDGYPDAVTLRPDATLALLEVIDSRPRCSVKDSFTSLDLARHGFEVLFEAQWIALTEASSRAAKLEWSVVPSAAAVDQWHGGALTAAVLGAPGVTPLVGRSDGEIVAGAIVTMFAEVSGVSNVFAPTGLVDVVWSDLAVVVPVLRPVAPVVGYERYEALAAACAAGFSPVGPLRIWHNP